MIPGFAISLLAIVIVSLLTQPSKEVEEQFEDFEKQHRHIYKISAVIVTAEILQFDNLLIKFNKFFMFR